MYLFADRFPTTATGWIAQSTVEYTVMGLLVIFFGLATLLHFIGGSLRSRPGLRFEHATTTCVPPPTLSPDTGFWQRILSWWYQEKAVVQGFWNEAVTGQPWTSPQPTRTYRFPKAESTEYSGTERRRWVRRPSNLLAVCGLPNQPDYGLWMARVRDISQGGVGLLSPRPLPLGTVFLLQLQGPKDKRSTPIRAEVIFLTEESPDTWTLGCEFINPLIEEDQQSFL